MATTTCQGCGAKLSRYNDGDRCAACSAAADPANSGGESWLRRGTGAEATDDVGAVIREWRATNKQSQGAVAELLGMTQQHLSYVENGRRPLSVEQRRHVVDLLGIAPEELGLAARRRSAVSPDDASEEIAASRVRWRSQRRWLNKHRSELAQLAVQLYPEQHRIPRTPLIAHSDWVPAEPVDLSALTLELDESPQDVAVDGAEPETLAVRPLRSPGTPFDRYTSVIKHLDPPQLFESRPSYRLLDASLADGRLGFGLAAYFDKLDVSEALGHEIAATCLSHSGTLPTPDELRGHLPFRELIGDPFDPKQRAIIPAITTLTIRLRRHPEPPSFLLHWRDPAKVATAGGIYDVIPAGEFQPSSVALWDRRNDFDLWRNIVREYSEELLGAPEHDGTRTAPIDYDGWSLYQQLAAARKDSTVAAHFLGLGLDALTLAATILTVVVIDDDVFADLFGEATRYNEEGEIVAVGDGKPAEGIPFTADAVERMLSSEPMASPGAACLALAWQHRQHLGI